MLKVETESFRLMKALFRDNELFVFFKTTKEIEELFKKLRNLYIRYKVVVFNHKDSSFELIKKSAYKLTQSYLAAKIELDVIRSVEETKIEISSLSFHLQDGRKVNFPISQRISLINILINDPDMLLEFNTTKKVEENIDKHKNNKIQKIQPKHKGFNENLSFPINKEELGKSLDLDFQRVNEKIEQKLKSDPINIEINQLVYRCLNLLLSNLTTPYEGEIDFKINPIIKAVQKYINIDLIKDRSDNQ